VLEAAIGPLSAPQPSSDGERDMRPVGRRRGEALVGVCRRATGAGGQISSATKASVYVTINLGELQARAGAATAIGSLDGGALLGPETARKLACDAGTIPVVLGSDGEIFIWARTQRLFTSGQVKALWLRDPHCTFTGCDARLIGAMRITCGIGSMVGQRIGPTPLCSADATTPSCTAINLSAPSSTVKSSGTEDRARYQRLSTTSAASNGPRESSARNCSMLLAVSATADFEGSVAEAEVHGEPGAIQPWLVGY